MFPSFRRLLERSKLTTSLRRQNNLALGSPGRQVAVGVNWDPIASVRFAAEVVRIIADQRPWVFDSHGRDTSYLFRAQMHF